MLLYDLTRIYREGAAEKNAMMRRGYPRDHRPDCEQMVIALIANTEAFPFSCETFDGNRAGVTTMETILRMVERTPGAPPLGVRSRGGQRGKSAGHRQAWRAVSGGHAAQPDKAV